MKTLIKCIGAFIIFLLVVVMAAVSSSSDKKNSSSGGFSGKAKVPDAVEQYESAVKEYCEKYGIDKYEDIILAIMAQESGGNTSLDVMQSSESLGLAANSIQDPMESIDAGVLHFKTALDYGNSKGVDFNTILQSYNYGIGFIDYVAANGGKYSKDLAQSFSAKEAVANGWSSYGDSDYVDHVMKYVDTSSSTATSSDSASEGISNDEYNNLMKVATTYEGQPYVFGGDSPTTGFDCSGIVQYSYSQIGINLGRTAQEQYDECTMVSDPQPGDLVFFQGTYSCADYITHVGIYVGDNRMYQSGGSGLGYIDLSKEYYKEHLVGYGRINR